ncbi:hypothetical protein GGI13_003497 [Coemansia sp. RSA 455]|nr:hypothetical protein GGI13_003497 [Coemansia sp. RSA 455]
MDIQENKKSEETQDARGTQNNKETQETKDYVVLLETRDKIENKIEVYSKMMYSAIDYLKTQGHVIQKTYAMKPAVMQSKTFVLFGKGVYAMGDGDDYFDDDTEVLVLNMTNGDWSIVTDKRKIAHRRAHIISRHVRIKGRPLIVGYCGKCHHVIPRILGPCIENCSCCPKVPIAPTPLEEE